MTIAVLEKALSHEQCDYLISLAKNKWDTGITADSIHQSARKSDICWIQDDDIKKKVTDLYSTANETAQWNFDIWAVEDIQIARYRRGEFYSWHTDGNGLRSIPNSPGHVRKLSMSILLNDDYTGGELEIKHGMMEAKIPNRNGPNKMEGSKGTIIVFPSYFMHRVKPVKKGTRYSLVAWFGGPKFI
jgi:PKHD-type hydroxylase